jgi:hypothetical protein
MFKRLLLALAMIAALAACNTPAGTSNPTTNVGSSSPPSVESPADSGLESMEPGASDSGLESMEPSPSAS